MSNAAIVARMRAAGIPPHTFHTSLEQIGQKRFAEILTNREFDLGHGHIASYIVRGQRKDAANVTQVCALAAKSLIAIQRVAIYTTVPALNEFLKTGEHHNTTGYVVVGDLGNNTQNIPAAEWDRMQSFFVSHVARGGGLILGDNGVINNGQLCLDLIDAISVFEEIVIQ